MAWTGRLRRLGHDVLDGAGLRRSAELRNPLSVLGPDRSGTAGTVGTRGPGDGEAGPPSARPHGWQYLIASSSTVGGRRSWALMGTPTDVDVDGDASPARVAAALAEHGWHMVTTSPPTPSNQGMINYIFRRLIPEPACSGGAGGATR